MRAVLVALLFAMPVADAGTVLTYVWPDDPQTTVLSVEIDAGKLRWHWVMNETEWYVFDAATRTITGYRGDEEKLYDVYRDEEPEERSTPKLLGKARRAKQECAMYAFDVYGATEKVCLVAAAKLGIPESDAATLHAFADVLHRMQDAAVFSDGMPLAFSGVEGVGIWRSNSAVLSKVEQRAVPAERFARPAGYTLYVPPPIDGK